LAAFSASLNHRSGSKEVYINKLNVQISGSQSILFVSFFQWMSSVSEFLLAAVRRGASWGKFQQATQH